MKPERRTASNQVYQITVAGRLSPEWPAWFSGMHVEAALGRDGRPVTVLTGPTDQAGLRGVLNRLWDLNLTLISIVPIEPPGSTVSKEVCDD